MATYSSRDHHKHWREYVLPNPSYAAELGKAQQAVINEMTRLGLDVSYDDAYEVLATEEEIILRFLVTDESEQWRIPPGAVSEDEEEPEEPLGASIDLSRLNPSGDRTRPGW